VSDLWNDYAYDPFAGESDVEPTPIFDALIESYAPPESLMDTMARRMAEAYLDDDLLAAVVAKWAVES
jgi:hypothetical protein